jgi:hypothetical protein
MSSTETPTDSDRPNYSVEIDAADLREDLAEKAASAARKHAYCARSYREDDWCGYRQWMQEHRRKMRAYATAIAMLQPGRYNVLVPRGAFVGDETVNLREYMREISRLGDEAHDRGDREAESAYAKVNSLLRNEYDVGWPRLDELGGNPLEEDLP